MAEKGSKRRGGQRIVIWAILALLIVGLAGFGVQNFGGRVTDIGSVGSTDISAEAYGRALQQELRALEAQTGQAMTLAEAQAFGLDRAVLARLLGQAALDEEARRLGLSVGDAAVSEAIVGIEAFQGPTGGFDRQAYDFALDRVGMTPADFEEQIRAETARGLLQSAVAGAARVPASFVDRLYAFARETRDVSFARLGPEALAAPLPEPTEDVLRAYHEANAVEFTTPETRRITYAWLAPERLASEVEVEEEALRALYAEREAEFVQPERRLAERLIFGSAEAAAEAARAIAAGETTFEAVIEERGLALEDADLGEVSREDLGGAAEAVFALAEPGIAGPVETALGPALFRVNAVLAAQETPFEAVRETLRDELVADRSRRLAADRFDAIEDRLAEGATLEELGDEPGVEVGTMDYSAGVSEGLAGYAAFRVAAEAASEGDFPEVVRLDDGGLFALRLDAVEPPAVEPFEAVGDRVLEAWQREETARGLRAAAEAAKARLDAGAPPEEAGITFASATGLEREGVLADLPPAAVEATFGLAAGETAVVDAEGGPVILRLDRVVPPSGADVEAQALKTVLAEQAAQGLATDLVEAYVRAIEADLGIGLDQGALNAVHASFP